MEQSFDDRIKQQVVDHRLKNGLCHQCGSSTFSKNDDGVYAVPKCILGLVENGRCLFCYPNRATQPQSPPRTPLTTRNLNLASDSTLSTLPLASNPTADVAIKMEPGVTEEETAPDQIAAVPAVASLPPRPESPDVTRKRKASPVSNHDEDGNDTAKKPAAVTSVSPAPLVISDADGLPFTGTVMEGTRLNGRGVFTHQHTKGDRKGKSIVYEGGFFQGKFHGSGKSRDFATGCTYEGMFEHGAAHGFGKCRWAQGWEYEGEWHYDKRHGKGTCRQLENGGEVYAGEWKNDQWDGLGCLKFAGGGQYDGDFRRDKLHGKGKYQFADGSVYEGFFKEDLREGHGCMTYADRHRYVGEWRNNWRNGKGTLFHVDGSVFKGRYRGDEKDGIGYLHLPDGIVRKERWLNGQLQKT
jgi:hypothetical protein